MSRINSPFRRHQQKVRAQLLNVSGLSTQKAAPANPDAGADTEYGRLLEELGTDLAALSNIQSVERKIEAKRSMIERYTPWVEGVLLAGEEGGAVQDEIVANMLVWHMDVQNWPMALQIGAYMLTHRLSLPERYKRTPATVIAEEIAETSLRDGSAVDHGTLIATQALTDPHDMPDEVRAKLMKAIGRKLVAEAEAFDPDAEGATAGGKPAILSAALDAFKRAAALDRKAGVVKNIETLERELKKLAPPD